MSVFGMIFRTMCTKGDRKRDENYILPEDVTYIQDIPYSNNSDQWNKLDICRPSNDTKLPVIVSVHGGGYVYGTKEAYKPYSAFLAQQGFVVVNFNYHLAPKTKFPKQLGELNDVMQWIDQQIATYQGDKDNIFMVGDSAGAQQASQYLTICTNADYAKYFQFQIPKLNIKAVALNCGLYDISDNAQPYFKVIKETYHMDTIALLKDYLGNKSKINQELLNVAKYITKDFPPAFVMTSSNDFLRNGAQPFADLLTSRGVKNIVKIYGEADDKRYSHVFHLIWNFDGALQCNLDECEFFNSFL